VADPFGAGRFLVNFDLPIRPEPTEPRWQSITWGGVRLRQSFGSPLRRYSHGISQFWELQQNLWLIRRYHRVYDVDVAFDKVVLVGAKLNAEVEQKMGGAKLAGGSSPSRA
jgi:hypothetical protein